MSKLDITQVRRQAEKLAQASMEAEPNIQEVYWFPADNEIRLVEIDPTAPRSDVIAPFYFEPGPAHAAGCTAAVAIIQPVEKESLSPPKDWGPWDKAKQIRKRG